MIRCDLYKGKENHFNNRFVEAVRDAQPRHARVDKEAEENGLITDLGNVGYIPNANGAHPFGGQYVNGAVPPRSLHGYLYEQLAQPYAASTFPTPLAYSPRR